MSPSSCIVLVPFGSYIEPNCEQALHALERQGYTVRRVPGFSAIDFGRSVMASHALAEGFQELLWIDSDIIFNPHDVARLRAHPFPLVGGIYAKKSRPEFACDFLPGTEKIVFGKEGGLYEVRYSGLGFFWTRREVYETMRHKFRLPECNQRFGQPIAPFFMPMLVPDGQGMWYLSEDYAFCERARQCGFKIMMDTTIRLAHVGSYGYTWEEVGPKRERFTNYTVNMNWNSPNASPKTALPDTLLPEPDSTGQPSMFTADWTSRHLPTWERLLGPLKGQNIRALEVGVFEGRTTLWLLEKVLTHPDASLTYIDTFEGGADQADLHLGGMEERFHRNTLAYAHKLIGHKGRSEEKLRGLPVDQFDFIYIDGSHEAPDVLSDAVLSWPLLKVGGILAFDDYEWQGFPEPARCPKSAIDAFLPIMEGRYEALHQGYQLWLRKLR